MIRFLYVPTALLLACAVLAAPAPNPFLSGWDYPVNPDGDCKIRRDDGALAIEMPGTHHDYGPVQGRFNAPRLLRDLEGDFEIQVRARINCQPSARSNVEGQPSFVSAGFLIIPPNNYSLNEYAPTYIRFEYGVSRERIGADGYASLKTLDRKEREETETWVGGDGCTALKTVRRTGQQIKEFWDTLRSKWPLQKKPDQVYLRLERRDVSFNFFISPDGEKWTSLVMQTGPPAQLKLGLAAYTTSSEPSKVRFDQLKIARSKKRKR